MLVLERRCQVAHSGVGVCWDCGIGRSDFVDGSVSPEVRMNGAMSAVQPADCSSGRIGDRDDNVGDEVPLVPEFGSDGVVAGCSGDGLGDEFVPVDAVLLRGHVLILSATSDT